MKKFYAFSAFILFLAFAGTAFAARPVVNLHAASNITTNSATLSLSYQSATPVTVIMFEYSTDASFGSNVVTRSGTASSISITGLTSNTRYYYRAMVGNSDGPTTEPTSGAYSFTTLSAQTQTPYVETLGETNVTTSSLTLNGRINTYGASGTYQFKYYNAACTSLIGTTTVNSLSASSGTQNVNAGISSLSLNTTYCAELVATIGGQTYNGGKVAVKTTGGGNSSNQCIIDNFSVSPNPITAGAYATLTWATTNCTSASISGIGAVNVDDSRSISPSVSTNYTLTASNSLNTDSRTVTVNISNSSQNYPSCYYDGSCYWNGTSWINYNTNSQNYPVCYYSGECYNNGSTWVFYPNYSNQKPPCFYNNMCYQSGNYWYYYQSYVPAQPAVSVQPYAYVPHVKYTASPTYVYKQAAPVVKTVYVDQPVVTTPVTYVDHVDHVDPLAYNGYPIQPTYDIMAKYTPRYDYVVTDRVSLTGSAGRSVNITLIGLLIALIIIGTIVYLVRSNRTRYD